MNQSDLARSMAAGMGVAAEDPAGALDALPEEGMPQPAGPTALEGIESALVEIENALEGYDPDKATQIRTHLNAIREVVGQATTEGEGMDSAAIEPPIPADQGTDMKEMI